MSTIELAIQELKERDKEIERQQSIIKEVRKYIEENLVQQENGCGCWWYGFDDYVDAKKELLEILDKVGSDKE